jgi:hypothetical protein
MIKRVNNFDETNSLLANGNLLAVIMDSLQGEKF